MKKANDWKRKNICFAIMGTILLLIAILIMSGGYRKIFSRHDNVITVGWFSDSYWEVQNGYSYQILDDAIALFEKENPGVKVEYVSGILKENYIEWLSGQMILGNAPDVFIIFGENFNDFAEIGGLKNLDSLMEADDSFTQEMFYSSAFAGGKYKDGQYALPYECAPKLMFVNKTILTAEGIELPKEDWTWNDFYEICRKVTKDTDANGVPDQFGVVGYTWSDAFNSNGVTLFNENGTECYLKDDRVRDAILFMEDLDRLHEGYNVTGKDFDLGKVAFEPMYFSQYRAYKPYPLSIKKYSAFEWECIPMPSGPSGSNISELDTILLAMNKNTAQTGYAWEFMKLLAADERVQSEIFKYSEGVSVIRDVTESDNTLRLLMESSGEDSGFNLEVLRYAVENAVIIPGFRNREAAVLEVDQAVREIVGSNTNISMELIIRNRKINNFLKDKQKK